MAMAATKSLASIQKRPQRGSTGRDDPLETSQTRRSNTGLWHGGGCYHLSYEGYIQWLID
jgi:hypothetical protein